MPYLISLESARQPKKVVTAKKKLWQRKKVCEGFYLTAKSFFSLSGTYSRCHQLFFAVEHLFSLSYDWQRNTYSPKFGILQPTMRICIFELADQQWRHSQVRTVFEFLNTTHGNDCSFLIGRAMASNQKFMNWTLFEEEFCSKLTNHSCLPKWLMRYDPCWKLFWAHEDPFSEILIFQMFISYFKRAFTLFALGFLN